MYLVSLIFRFYFSYMFSWPIKQRVRRLPFNNLRIKIYVYVMRCHKAFHRWYTKWSISFYANTFPWVMIYIKRSSIQPLYWITTLRFYVAWKDITLSTKMCFPLCCGYTKRYIPLGKVLAVCSWILCINDQKENFRKAKLGFPLA